MIIKKLIHACSNKKEIKFNISVPAKTVTTAGEIIDTSAIMSPFDLSNLTPRANGDCYYLLEHSNRSIALDYLDLINNLILQAKRHYRAIPDKQFKKSLFNSQMNSTGSYNLQLAFNPLTKKENRFPKAAYTILYYPNDEIFADLNFNVSGDIVSLKIIIWKKYTCFQVNCTCIDNSLTVNRIYMTNPDNYKKEVVYKYNK